VDPELTILLVVKATGLNLVQNKEETMTCKGKVNDQQQEPDFNALKLEYEMVCKTHDGIADFRAKLLALLPIASGAGIFLLLKNLSPVGQQHLSIIGIFGISITVGLFLYELKNIQKCNSLIDCGKILESKLFCCFSEVGMFTGGRIPDEKSINKPEGNPESGRNSQ
jgi:hypothetical protein